MLTVSEECLAKAKALLKSRAQSWNSGLCKGGTMTLDGKETQHGSHGACHSWVGYAYGDLCGVVDTTYPNSTYKMAPWDDKYGEDSKPFLTINCHTTAMSQVSKEATVGIVKWLASDESPFGAYILNRDDTDSLLNYGAVILCGPGGLTYAQSLWVCKVMRLITEGGKSLETWWALYSAGVNPLIALYVASHVQPGGKGGVYSESKVSSHVSVFYSYTTEGTNGILGGLVFGEISTKAKDTSSVFKNAEANKRLPKLKEALSTKVRGFCKPFVKDDGWGGKITGNGATKDQLIELVLKWQEELGGYTPFNFPATGNISSLQSVPEALPLPTSSTVYLELDL